MATISLGMIVRNEGRTLRALLDSVSPFVSQIVIGLGGESTDDTESILKEYPLPVGSEVFKFEWENDFSAARNAVFEKCTGEYFLWLDGDDVLEGGEKFQSYIQNYPNVDSFYFGYDYAQDDNGLCVCYLIRERLVKREGREWKWLGKIHEVLVPQFPEQNVMKVDDIVVHHHKPQGKHDPDRNLDILYSQLRETEPTPDPRILVYLGSENLSRGNISEAIVHYQRFVKLSGWDEEKYQAQCRIGTAYLMQGKPEKALEAAQMAISMLPEWPDAYFGMAKAYIELSNWKAALEYLKIGVSKPKPRTMLIINPMEYTYEPALMIANCYVQLGDLDVAIQNYRNAYALRQDPIVAQQMQMIEKQISLTEVAGAFLVLREHLGRHDEWLKVRKMFDIVPKHLQNHSGIHDAWNRTAQQTGHIDNPQIMTDFYNDNPHWAPMNEEQFAHPDWLKYPRMKFALDVARRVDAKTVVDWGCSDGFIALPLARELGARVTGFDLDPRCIELATVRGNQWGTNTRFEVGNVDEIGSWEGEKADLAIFFEIIEHVVEPRVTLERLEKTAKHIAITTPYMAWEDGNIPAWDKVEPKGHLRIFDQFDMEALLTGRGQIMNIYREPWGNGGWLFADYKPGVQLKNETIIIGAQSGLEQWGPRKLQEGGLGGSETAVIRLAEAFAKGGRRPIVYNPIDESGYYNGVCYRPVEHFRPEIRSDLYIAWRMPEAADWEINTRHLSLWLHDVDAGDRLTKDRARKFDSFVVLTEWHKKHVQTTYPFIPENKIHVIGNGVDLDRFSGTAIRNPKKVIYSSSPDRGLDILLEHIWPKVIAQVPDAELHVYYGWDNFTKSAALPGMGFLNEFKTKMDRLFLDCKNVVQHGRIPQDRLAQEMQEAEIWLYPTYFSETYCITAVEAQLAGAIPITSRLAGLESTVQSGPVIEGDVHDPAVQQAYIDATVFLLKEKKTPEFYESIKSKTPARSWDQIAHEWEQLIPKEN